MTLKGAEYLLTAATVKFFFLKHDSKVKIYFNRDVCQTNVKNMLLEESKINTNQKNDSLYFDKNASAVQTFSSLFRGPKCNSCTKKVRNNKSIKKLIL